VAGAGLPAEVTATATGQVQELVGVPLRVTGTLRLVRPDGEPVAGAVSGPATTALPDGAQVAGTLPPGGVAQLRVELNEPATLDLALTAVPTLDDRVLAPPADAPSWAAWAAPKPGVSARRAALNLLVRTAATGARARSYAPYLGADLPGTGTTSFRYSFAPVARGEQPAAPLTPRPGAIGAAALAVLLLAGNGALLWRQS
jgi:hypothetical protein